MTRLRSTKFSILRAGSIISDKVDFRLGVAPIIDLIAKFRKEKFQQIKDDYKLLDLHI